jgi:outer membrane protein OmpA-like peptidoglycan-associated protein
MQILDLAFARGIAIVLALALAITAWLARPTEQTKRGRVIVTDTETTILDVIEFAPGTPTLRASSRPTLDAVAETLRVNPSIELVEVQSHTSGIGNAAANQELSDQRAAVIVKYLDAAGVEPSRLVAQGYGDTQPIERGATAKNERVSFLILKRAPEAAPGEP